MQLEDVEKKGCAGPFFCLIFTILFSLSFSDTFTAQSILFENDINVEYNGVMKLREKFSKKERFV